MDTSKQFRGDNRLLLGIVLGHYLLAIRAVTC